MLKAVVVFDPEERAARNLDDELVYIQTEEEVAMVAKTAQEVLLVLLGEKAPKTDLSSFGGVVSLEKVKRLGMNHTSLHYFEGHYNTMRFAFPNSLKKPLFYRVKGEDFEYPKYKIFADDLLMSFNLHGLVARNRLEVYFKDDNQLLSGGNFFLHSENYIFNKLASVFDFNESEEGMVTKVSDSDLARRLIDKEANLLRGLAPILKQDAVRIPEVALYGSSLVLSNNYPNGGEMSDQLEDLHLKALTDLYEVNLNVKKVQQILEDSSYLNTIKAFKLILAEGLHPNGISQKHVEEICIDLITLMNRLNSREPVHTALYHGDFSPKNCLVKGNQLYLNNFGKCENDMPLLFDAFHYIFHHLEKDNMPKMGELDDIMKHLFKNKQLMKMIEKYNINFKLNLALFHVHYVTTQIENFIKQRFVHPNVNFVLSFYRQALERMNSISI